MSIQREPLLRITWTDPVTGINGYCVIHRLVGSIATGGLRMRRGCTLAEVEDLARGMSAKAGVFGLPVGGAKGGIDCDPHDPRARAVLARYVAAMRPLLDACWVTAEDLGVRQDLLDAVFDEAGLGMSLHAALVRSPNPDATLARVRKAFVTDVDGVALPDMIGGFGVAEAAVAALRHLGREPSGARAVVQGFGSMGGSTARYLVQHGVRVVAVVDRNGVITNPDRGLDVEALLRARSDYGDIDRGALRADDRQVGVGEWLGIDADVLVPAAVSYALTAGNADDVTARVVVEAANVPTTPEAEARLAERGVPVIPDFVANAGAAAWAWWTLFGEVGVDPQDAFDKLRADMGTAVFEVLAGYACGEGTPREVALRISRRNLDAFDLEYAEGRPPKAIA
ncbi:MAG: glutamate dehydrogenase [Euzebyales bacterium]|nr:glutamate dehydrogenase [Euzebyales bacterium]